MNVKYAVLVDNERTDEFSVLAPLSECQVDSVARDYAMRYGMQDFGMNGVKIVRVETKNDYKINEKMPVCGGSPGTQEDAVL